MTKRASPMARFVVPEPGSATSSSAAESSDVSARQPPTVNESAPSDGSGPGSGTVSSFVSNDAALTAELYWALHATDKNYSFISCSKAGDLFRTMFPDSAIASKFACGERKLSYLNTFGIAPVFASMLSAKVKETPDFVLLFDESLNHDLQSKQLDVHVRLWDAGRVSTRYCTSNFLGHACADVLQDKLSEAASRFGKRGILQLSMDGPNVNWKTFDLLQAEVETETGRSLLNIGSCGLHIMHNAFRRAFLGTKWAIDSALQSLHWLFKDAPARREDFASMWKDSEPLFPKRFCPHRWVENEDVAARALEIWPKVQKFVGQAALGAVPQPSSKSFEAVKEACADPLFVTKLEIFRSVAKQVDVFLVKYQTDAPSCPSFRRPDRGDEEFTSADS